MAAKQARYKYTGPAGGHSVAEPTNPDDPNSPVERRYLEPGEAVELTDAQFAAFQDRFEDTQAKSGNSKPLIPEDDPKKTSGQDPKIHPVAVTPGVVLTPETAVSPEGEPPHAGQITADAAKNPSPATGATTSTGQPAPAPSTKK
jgi:hypothetical protein